MTKNEAAAELEIDLAANPTIEDIKKAYKTAALKWCFPRHAANQTPAPPFRAANRKPERGGSAGILTRIHHPMPPPSSSALEKRTSDSRRYFLPPSSHAGFDSYMKPLQGGRVQLLAAERGRVAQALDGEDSDGDDMFEMNMEDVFNVFERFHPSLNKTATLFIANHDQATRLCPLKTHFMPQPDNPFSFLRIHHRSLPATVPTPMLPAAAMQPRPEYPPRGVNPNP